MLPSHGIARLLLLLYFWEKLKCLPICKLFLLRNVQYCTCQFFHCCGADLQILVPDAAKKNRLQTALQNLVLTKESYTDDGGECCPFSVGYTYVDSLVLTYVLYNCPGSVHLSLVPFIYCSVYGAMSLKVFFHFCPCPFKNIMSLL